MSFIRLVIPDMIRNPVFFWIPAFAVILMGPFILRYGKFNTNPIDTPIPPPGLPLEGGGT